MKFIPVNDIRRTATINDGEIPPERLMRMGMFKIRRHVIEKYPHVMQKIFERVVPMEYDVLFNEDLMGNVTIRFQKEIENSFVADSILYTGYSPDFEETPQGSYVKQGEEVMTTTARKVTFF
jgi:hypothetical protein